MTFLIVIGIAIILSYFIRLFISVPKGFHLTREGELLKISEMSIDHLKNCINYANQNVSTGKVNDKYWNNLVPQFEEELKKRS